VTNLLHSATYVLAAHQDVQDRVYEEVMAVTERNLGQISYESVNEMTYLDMVLAGIQVENNLISCKYSG
jgi:cytochrome P450